MYTIILVVLGVAMSGALFFMYTMMFKNNDTVLDIPPHDALYRQASFPIEERIDDLIARMTLAEKIGQMALVEKNSIHNPDDIATYGIGALLSGFGANPEKNSGEGWAAMVGDFVAYSRTSRLGIPILYGVDAIHGHSNVVGATVFPHFIGLGASGDAALVTDVARATGEELRATNVRWSFSPTLDLPRDIRWGRTYETFSDDPVLVARLGAAYVNGLQEGVQGGATSTISVLSTPKHFIGAGSMVWGSSSNHNFSVDQGTTVPDEEALRTEYLPPFKAAIDAGAQSIMVGLNSWGESKLSAEKYLVTTVLKSDLGFQGFAVSDWYGVYEIPGSEYTAAVTAINAGIDMVMLPFDYKPFVKNVTRAVRIGDINESRINDAVRRILRAKFALGLFEADAATTPVSAVGGSEHRALARKAVASSLVLLKNEHGALPISDDIQNIRIAGSAADNVGRQMGAWSVEWQGIDGNWLPGSTSILEGIRARAGDSVHIEYEPTGAFMRRDIADLGIAVVGEAPYAEGWGDREYPILSTEDLAAIKKLQETSRRVVVVLVSGRPLLVSNEIDSWDGVVAAWLPGSEGAGVADVLFGDVPFTGTLPLPWPHHSEQLPITVEGETADGTPVLFPRYFGLR
jgi:beta-glucosidase